MRLKIIDRTRFANTDRDYFEPDFLVERVDGMFEIVDLKTPQEGFLKERNAHDPFYQRINEYIGQVCNYSLYFTEGRHRDYVKDRYGIDVQPEPDKALIIGRDAGIDMRAIRQNIRDLKATHVNLQTYDDVRCALDAHYALFYGQSEGLPGFSLHANISIAGAFRLGLVYIFECGAAPDANRISIYLDNSNQLCFDVVDSQRNRYNVSVQPGMFDFEFGRPFSLCCELGISSKFSFLRLFINNRLASETRVEYPLILKFDYSELETRRVMYTLSTKLREFNVISFGCDLQGKAKLQHTWTQSKGWIFGANLPKSFYEFFTIAAVAVYSKVLTFQQRTGVASRLSEL